MRAWVTASVITLQASLSLAADVPNAVTHSTFPEPDMSDVLLGRLLFYDPILSGNQDIACATCHHPKFGTSDGMSLSIGTGARGLGPDRRVSEGNTITARIPRNAPALWNLGSFEFGTLFHDGRVAVDASAPRGVTMPEGRALPGPVSAPLAAQALLPLLSAEEMAGQAGENPVADALAEGNASLAWQILADRVAAIPNYKARFAPGEDAGAPLKITEISEAIAAFIAFEFRATDSAFDAYLRGDTDALSGAQKRGMDLFYGAAGCASCHSGVFQTDHQFHAVGMPQLGPGKNAPLAPFADFGRFAVTGDPDDLYRFRTPSLRNVTETAPYGHAGAYATLNAVIRHKAAPTQSLLSYDRGQAVLHDLPFDDWKALNNETELLEIAAAIELPSQDLSEDAIRDIEAFLGALTDRGALRGRLGVPETVPSGLPVDR